MLLSAMSFYLKMVIDKRRTIRIYANSCHFRSRVPTKVPTVQLAEDSPFTTKLRGGDHSNRHLWARQRRERPNLAQVCPVWRFCTVSDPETPPQSRGARVR